MTTREIIIAKLREQFSELDVQTVLELIDDYVQEEINDALREQDELSD